MRVKVRLFANFREVMGTGNLEVENVHNIGELLSKLTEMKREMEKELYYPGTKELVKTVQIMHNGKNVKLPQGLEAELKEGDEIAIFPPVAGGEGSNTSASHVS